MQPEVLQATLTLNAKDKPYVRFDTKEVEDPKRTKELGRLTYRNQDYAVVTAPGGKSNNVHRIESFWELMEQESRSGRIDYAWLQQWRAAYESYKAGQQPALDGTPIHGWKLLSNAQQQDLIQFNVMTVEQLANLTDEGMRNLGMGALEMKRRAQAWIAQNDAKESGTLKLAELSRENDSLRDQVLMLSNKLDELERTALKKGK